MRNLGELAVPGYPRAFQRRELHWERKGNSPGGECTAGLGEGRAWGLGLTVLMSWQVGSHGMQKSSSSGHFQV